MSIFKQLCRTLVLSAVVVALSVGLMGCPDTPPDDEDNNQSGVGNRCGVDGTAGSCRTVKIGNQTWMAENMNKETAESWCYNDSPDSCAKYGRLYPWAEAKAVCPKGWHLPSRDEWEKLVVAAGDVPANGLKSASGWCCNAGGSDYLGFAALPSGHRHFTGAFGEITSKVHWWSSTETNIDQANCTSIDWDWRNVVTDWESDKGYGFAVRCVKDD